MKLFQILVICILILSFKETSENRALLGRNSVLDSDITGISLVILGTVQDAGSPHIACTKDCCRELFLHADSSRKVVSLGLVIPETSRTFLFEATPDMTTQVKSLHRYSGFDGKETPDGVFVTHAHIGHYTGLMYLGKEAMNANKIPVYAMPRMTTFLEQNGPWGQLVTNQNISLQEMAHQQKVSLAQDVLVTPFLVPHRDEYSETVGFMIEGPTKKVLFIPDIDKWEKWETGIIELIAEVDYAFIDGTFYDGEEIPHRDISEIPHPFIVESMELFKDLTRTEKQKIYFIHLNHTNPALNPLSEQSQEILRNGFKVARINEVFKI